MNRFCIHLSESDQELVRSVAEQKFKLTRAAKIDNGKIGKQSNEQTEIEGFGGEVAFCRLAGISPNLDPKPKSARHGDRGDCTLHGLWVDVKTTKYSGGCLHVNTSKRFGECADWFALMVGQFPRYRFAGFMKASDIICEKRLEDTGGYGRLIYVARQSELIRGK